MWGSVKGSVLEPHTLTHFPTPPLFLSPHFLPHANTLPHSPHTPSRTSPLPTHLSLLISTPQHTSLHSTPPSTSPIPLQSSHSFSHLALHPNTLPHSPHALSHTSTHSLDYVAKLPCDELTLNLTGLWKSPIKFFMTTRNLMSCFGVDNVNFRCMKVWRSYHVAKLLATYSNTITSISCSLNLFLKLSLYIEFV